MEGETKQDIEERLKTIIRHHFLRMADIQLTFFNQSSSVGLPVISSSPFSVRLFPIFFRFLLSLFYLLQCVFPSFFVLFPAKCVRWGLINKVVWRVWWSLMCSFRDEVNDVASMTWPDLSFTRTEYPFPVRSSLTTCPLVPHLLFRSQIKPLTISGYTIHHEGRVKSMFLLFQITMVYVWLLRFQNDTVRLKLCCSITHFFLLSSWSWQCLVCSHNDVIVYIKLAMLIDHAGPYHSERNFAFDIIFHTDLL